MQPNIRSRIMANVFLGLQLTYPVVFIQLMDFSWEMKIPEW